MGRRLLPPPFVLEVEEERLVGAVNPFHDILDGLGIQCTPMGKTLHALQLRNELFDTVGGGIHLRRFVIPPVEGNTPVPDLSGKIDARLQMLELSALIELELVCLY